MLNLHFLTIFNLCVKNFYLGRFKSFFVFVFTKKFVLCKIIFFITAYQAIFKLFIVIENYITYTNCY